MYRDEMRIMMTRDQWSNAREDGDSFSELRPFGLRAASRELSV